MARGLGEDPAGARWFRSPGRVNLMGDHTDYNEGFCLPVAIDLDCVVAVHRSQDGRIRLRTLDIGPWSSDALDIEADGGDDPRGVEPNWGRYVAGVARALAERGRPSVGLTGVISSTVPPGSGLASSAALEVACGLALCHVAGFQLPARELALACREGEEVATGVPCGVMDQLVALLARAGCALLIDCRSLAVDPVPIPDDLAILVVHSGVPRSLDQTAYAERRSSCEAIAATLGLRSLRDADPTAVSTHPLARHVVSENERVLATARALASGDRSALGRLLEESHRSLRDDFAVSTPELDALVQALVEAGALGARLTGAGFGGCVVALAERPAADTVLRRAIARYEAETGRPARPFLLRAVDGAGPLDPEA